MEMKTPYEKCPILRNSTVLSFMNDSIESEKRKPIQFQDASVRKSISILGKFGVLNFFATTLLLNAVLIFLSGM